MQNTAGPTQPYGGGEPGSFVLPGSFFCGDLGGGRRGVGGWGWEGERHVFGGREWKADLSRGSINDCSSEVGGMKGKLWGSVLLAAGVVGSCGTVSASNQTPLPCITGMRDALVKGHFTGPLVCSKKDATFVLVGRTAGDKFSIYDYRYRYLPTGGSVMHGGQKVIVFHDKTYVGQYAFSPPPYIIVTVNGTHVSLQTTGISKKIQMDLSREPPGQILINGEVETFGR